MPGTRLALPALAILLSCLCMAPASADGTLYYASDKAGFQGEVLAGLSRQGYVLAMTTDGASTLCVLYLDGKESGRTIRTPTEEGSREQVFEGTVLTEERSYDRSGNLIEERFYASPRPESAQSFSRRAYSYAGGMLVSVEAFDPFGAPEGKLEYRYDPSGRLLELLASGSFGSAQAGMAPGGSLPIASWFAIPSGSASPAVDDVLEITRYDASGRPVERSRYKGDECVLAELLFYDASGRLSSSRAFDVPAQTMSETSYDARGLPVLVVTTLNEVEQSRESLSYDGESRLLEDSVSTRASTTRKLYSYAGEGERSRETVIVNGITVSVTVERADGSVVKELYDRGVLFLRAFFRDGMLEREEFIEGGTVVRTKDYP